MAAAATAQVLQQSPGKLNGRFVIPSGEVAQHDGDKELDAYLFSLVEPASAMARAPISKFHVGAVGLGSSGAIYVGANQEFPGLHLNNSIHAEQFLLLNCLLHGEQGIRVLAVSEAPCGHCRQFYAELATSDTVRFVFGSGMHWMQQHHLSQRFAGSNSNGHNGTAHNGSSTPRPIAAYSLDQLLPARFGPHDLMTGGEEFPLLLEPQHNRVQLSQAAQQQVAQAQQQSGAPFAQAAQLAEEWARKSYTPYTRSPSGAAIITRDGRVYGGGYVESAAFNPSLTPFHAAWVAAVVDSVPSFTEIQHVVLADLPDANVQHMPGVSALLRAVCPTASITSLQLERCAVAAA